MNNITIATALDRGHILHAFRTNRLFHVMRGDMPGQRGEPGVYGCHITSVGFRRKGSPRWQHIPAARVIDNFQLYVPCRWDLECLAQGTLTVAYAGTGTLTVCPRHAAEHRTWETRCTDIPRPNRPWEPEPDCWCPDLDGGRMTVDYCPVHGTPQRRGHSLDNSLDANFATLNIDVTERAIDRTEV